MKENNLVTNEIISNLGKITERLGFTAATGIIFGTLYFNGKKTQQDLKTELNLALSSISQSLTMLEAFGFVKAEKQERKKLYYAVLDQNHAIFENIMRFNILPLAGLISTREGVVKDKETKVKLKKLKEACNKCCGKIEKIMK